MSSAVGTVASEVGHVAHFYDRVDTHVGHVADYLADALSSQVNVLIVARRALTEQISAALASRGLDVEDARRSGLLVDVDAEAVLARIQRPAGVDVDEFDALVRPAVRDAARGGGLAVYGELVSLLWEAGDVQGAIDVEDRWIHLADEFSFSLMCGYQATSMTAGQVDGFHDLCTRHSGVVGAPPDIVGAERGRRFPGCREALRGARRFVTETLGEWGLAALVDDAALVVGELTTNSVMHARSDFSVALSRTAGAVRVSVSDASDVLPRLATPSAHTVGGHGMHVVAALATVTGHELVAGGKVVWAELDLAGSEPSST